MWLVTRYILAGLLLVLAGCSSTRTYIDERYTSWQSQSPPPESELSHRVFLIGNAGAASADEPVLMLLKEQLESTGENGTVVFLGNNAYCCGLPDSASSTRQEAEAHLISLLQAVEDFPGRIIFIPGSRDWNNGRPGGLEMLARQESFIETYLDRGNTFLPDNGYPGPIPVELAEGITLVALDTQWWFNEERPVGDTGEYELREPDDFLIEFRDVLYKHRDNHIVVVGSHPLYSNGHHGGHFSLREHLTPLPVIGSVGPLYRRFIGHEQDMAHARYRLFRREMFDLFAGREDLIYAAGHDHNLQYFRKGRRGFSQHFIVSGTGSMSEYVADGHGATFTSGDKGFVSLQFYRDQSVWLEVWSPAAGSRAGRLLFRHCLKEPPANPAAETPDKKEKKSYPDYRDSTVVKAINPGYAEISGIGSLLAGKHHRKLWATPVKAPALDVERVAGGLTPIKIGGNSQSITFWLEGGDGKTYMLRSIDKVAGRSWPPEMRRTLARSLVQDQVSMLHPYGALIIPELADAIGVFHTNPRLVFVPDDPRLGGTSNPLAGQIVLFEERPDEDMSDVASMGYASNVIGTTKLFEEINGDNDHRVDARAWARARLLDMLIADHDRTTDNFRWSAFEPYELDPSLEGDERTQGKIYLPVPRDRDMAFMEVDGILPSLYRYFSEVTWQDFEYDYGFIRGLNKKGLPLDRRFAAPLSRRDWIEIADSIRQNLTDEVIEAAVRKLPDPIFDQVGAETIEILKVRRDKLPSVAEDYYGVLASVVDVVGSNKHERFEVTRLDSNKTEVTVFKTSKEGETRKPIFHRTLYGNETKELRLYGLGGNDQFIITGSVRDGIRIIAVGGAGDDTFSDSSLVRGRRKRTHFYDSPTGTQVNAGPETKITLKDDPIVNSYDRLGFKYDLVQPVGSFGSNKDNGLIVGGGVRITRHGFRKEPYARQHLITGDFAAKTKAFNIRYRGHYVELLGGWDVQLDAGVFNPNNTQNFFGLGNETTKARRNDSFYQARFSRMELKPALARETIPGVSFRIGPTLEYTNVRLDENRFVDQPESEVSDDVFGKLYYWGIETSLNVGTVDYRINPRQGFNFNTTIDFNSNLKDAAGTYAAFSSDLALYLSPSLYPQITIAGRVGGAHLLGRFPFFEANTLGGTENLRGYRSDRFAGRTSFYTNLDLRVQLHSFAGHLGYGELGVLGFVDNGRVWADGERSRVWHQGYGGGVWVHLFDSVLVAATYGISTEDQLFNLNLGFLF